MTISDHIEYILQNLKNENLSENTINGLNSIINRTNKEEWNCMEDFLGNIFSGLQQNIYNLETYGIDNEDDEFDKTNEQIAKAICSLLIAKNLFTEAKKSKN